jgi:hypothetical protein
MFLSQRISSKRAVSWGHFCSNFAQLAQGGHRTDDLASLLPHVDANAAAILIGKVDGPLMGCHPLFECKIRLSAF